jgi:hypothetical protein
MGSREPKRYCFEAEQKRRRNGAVLSQRTKGSHPHRRRPHTCFPRRSRCPHTIYVPELAGQTTFSHLNARLRTDGQMRLPAARARTKRLRRTPPEEELARMGFVPSQLLAGASTGAPGRKSLQPSIFFTIFKIGQTGVARRWVGSTPTPLRLQARIRGRSAVPSERRGQADSTGLLNLRGIRPRQACSVACNREPHRQMKQPFILDPTGARMAHRRLGLLAPQIPADPRPVRSGQDRPVTPEVAGSSPVAPRKALEIGIFWHLFRHGPDANRSPQRRFLGFWRAGRPEPILQIAPFKDTIGHRGGCATWPSPTRASSLLWRCDAADSKMGRTEHWREPAGDRDTRTHP